jgi:hypothetical protein
MAARKLGVLSISASMLALHRTWSECRESAAMRECLPLPNHALSEDGTWSHELVASRPIELLQESSGRSPFQHARLLCNVHVRWGCKSQIRVVMLEDLVMFCNQFKHVSHSILMLCKLQQMQSGNSISIFNTVNPNSPQHSWQAAAIPNHGWKLKLGWMID